MTLSDSIPQSNVKAVKQLFKFGRVRCPCCCLIHVLKPQLPRVLLPSIGRHHVLADTIKLLGCGIAASLLCQCQTVASSYVNLGAIIFALTYLVCSTYNAKILMHIHHTVTVCT